MAFRSEITIDQPRRIVADFLTKPETWFRLNPEWELRELHIGQETPDCLDFSMQVLYDRTELEAEYLGKLCRLPENEGISLELDGKAPRHIQILFSGVGDTVTSLVYEELGEAPLEPRKETELVLWLKSTADYLEICSRHSWHWRLVRYLLEKIWLKLNPTGRRVVFLIIAFELAALVFLIGLLIVQRWL
jgi:hypothetical protein